MSSFPLESRPIRLPRQGIRRASSTPERVRDFSKSISPAKNDRIDAGRIAHFAATVVGKPIERNQARERLDKMVTARQFLQHQMVAACNHARLLEREALADE